jgi:hypothetical protein
MLSVATEVPAPYRPNELDLEIFLANFSERRHGEVRRIFLPRTSVNKRQEASLSAVSSLARYSDRRAEDL